MAVTALYRISSGEVLKISPKGQTFADRDLAYFGVITDPVLPDGNTVRAINPDGTMGPLRVLGYAKHYVGIGQDIRNATQAEIDGYAAAEAQDDKAQDVDRVGQLFEQHPQWRKAFKALLKRVRAVTNPQAKKWNDLRVEIAAATNFADFQARVAAMGDLPTYSAAELMAALKADLNPED